jgi:hypothetical protein
VLLSLVIPVIELDSDERWRGYIRFTSHLQASNREALTSALNNKWNAGYVACCDYLRKMIPFPPKLMDQRLSIFAIYANAILSAREAVLEAQKSRHSRLWDQPFTTENILDTMEATLTCSPSAETIALS